jgi:thiol-disulfide isomerase/thioredoxin
MSTARELLRRLRGSRRAMTVAAAVAALVVAAALDVPARLGTLAPAEPQASARPTPSATATAPSGRFIGLSDAQNRQLDRCTPGETALASCGDAPALGAGTWFNTPDGAAVDLRDLRGSVVLVDFFSGSCVGCRRLGRYLNAWQSAYGASGLRVVGVHSPQHDFERDDRQVARTLDRLGITFPVLQDQGFATLTAYRTQVLPSTYLVDDRGTVRAVTLGEGGAARIEKQLRTLLRQRAGGAELPPAVGAIDGADTPIGTTTPIDLGRSDGRRYDTNSDTVVGDDTRFRLPPSQPEGTFSLGGLWTVDPDGSVPKASAEARVAYRGRTALQLVGGHGTLTVTTSEGTTRTVRIDGPPDLVAIAAADETGTRTLTVRYDGDLRVYAFSFG